MMDDPTYEGFKKLFHVFVKLSLSISLSLSFVYEIYILFS